MFSVGAVLETAQVSHSGVTGAFDHVRIRLEKLDTQ
jgi:hypothetical protein